MWPVLRHGQVSDRASVAATVIVLTLGVVILATVEPLGGARRRLGLAVAVTAVTTFLTGSARQTTLAKTEQTVSHNSSLLSL